MKPVISYTVILKMHLITISFSSYFFFPLFFLITHRDERNDHPHHIKIMNLFLKLKKKKKKNFSIKLHLSGVRKLHCTFTIFLVRK